MPNMDPKKCPMPVQDPEVRNKNFSEVALGYTPEMAVNEAKRCLHCKNKPCVSGCPVGIDIPGFIAKVAEEDFEGAYEVLSASSALPAVCGRVCPQENQCEGKCVRGIKTESVGIGRLERFVADWHREHFHGEPKMPVSNGHKVAVIGSGPSGLTAAGDLAKMGYKVTAVSYTHLDVYKRQPLNGARTLWCTLPPNTWTATPCRWAACWWIPAISTGKTENLKSFARRTRATTA